MKQLLIYAENLSLNFFLKYLVIPDFLHFLSLNYSYFNGHITVLYIYGMQSIVLIMYKTWND